MYIFRSLHLALHGRHRERTGNATDVWSLIRRLRIPLIRRQRPTTRPTQDKTPSPTPTNAFRHHTLRHRRPIIGVIHRLVPIHPILPRGNPQAFAAKHVAGEDVDDAEDADEDAGGDGQAVEVGPHGFAAGRGFVEVAEQGDAEEDHEGAEGEKGGARAEEGPVVGDVAGEEGDFREEEGDCGFVS